MHRELQTVLALGDALLRLPAEIDLEQIPFFLKVTPPRLWGQNYVSVLSVAGTHRAHLTREVHAVAISVGCKVLHPAEVEALLDNHSRRR